MVKELILHGGITLPCKLQDDELELICEEIRCLRPLITEEHELEIYLAHLTLYLKEYESLEVLVTDGLLQKLKSVAQQIERVLMSDGEYYERYREWAEALFQAKQRSEQELPSTEHSELDFLSYWTVEIRR